MVSRAAIGYLKGDQSIIGAYVHDNGSPEHSLQELRNYYSVPFLARSIVEIGAVETLRHPIASVRQIAPGRPVQCDNVVAFKRHFSILGCKHFYLYTPNEGWYES